MRTAISPNSNIILEAHLLSAGYVLAVVINVYQGLGAAMYVVFVGMLKPRLIPYLLILLAVIQDGPGIYKLPRFAAFGVLTAVMLLILTVRAQHFVKVGRHLISARYHQLVALGLMTVIYGFVVSYVVDAYSLSELLKSTRPWHLVALTNFVMILAAYGSLVMLSQDKNMTIRLTIVAQTSLMYLLFVALVQMLTHPTALHSDFLRQSNAFGYGSQMSSASTLGIARIASAMETPNAFCLSVAFLFMILFIGNQRYDNSLLLPSGMAVTGLFVGFITLSKAQMGYFVVASLLCFLLTRNYRFKLIGYLTIVTTLMILLYFGNTLMNIAAELFRVREIGTSTRGVLWEAVIEQMSIYDWIFGRGYGHWEELFAGVYRWKTITAPHNYILYVLGTFGLLGLFVYCVLFWLLFRTYRTLRHSNIRVALVAMMLLLFIFVKDLVTTSYVFNTSPLTYLLWLCVGLLCIPATTQYSTKSVPARNSRTRVKKPTS
ncbi:MAG: O-antigen ligase family protein [Granulosicoccus sp.]